MSRLIDITLPVFDGMTTWPGDRDVIVERVVDMDAGAHVNITNVTLCVHTGTHMDAPNHFLKDGAGLESIPLDTLVGPAQVVAFPDLDVIDAADLEGADIAADTTRLLIKTRNSALWDDPCHAFDESFVALTPAAAEWVVERGFQLVGIDYLSIERFQEPGNKTHHILLGADVVIVEGLDLRDVAPGSYRLTCLPMRLQGTDGSPVRAFLETA